MGLIEHARANLSLRSLHIERLKKTEIMQCLETKAPTGWLEGGVRAIIWQRRDFASADMSSLVEGISSLGTVILRVPFSGGGRGPPACDAARG